MNMKIVALQRDKAAKAKAARDLLDSVPTDRDMTAEEQSKFDGFKADVMRLDKRIEAEQVAHVETIEAPRIEVHDLKADDKKAGWKNFGEFAHAVRAAGVGARFDDRLLAGAATTSSTENTGTDGGFLVPAEFSKNIWMLSMDEDAFLPLTDNTPVAGNSMTFPKDESTPYGTSALTMYWEGENQAVTQQKVTGLKVNEYRLRKLMGVVPVSDELLNDSPAMTSWLTRKVATAVRYKTNDAIMNGTGVGQPKGFANATAVVTQAAEGSQTATTINANNVAKMLGRLAPGSAGNSRWIINPDCYNQLITMSIANQPIFTPPNGGIKDAPNGSLLGRPIVLSQLCQTLGTTGDIWLVDFGGYQTITKAGQGVQTDTSMHLFFDAGATAFRVVFRLDGGPSLSSAISAKNGSNTLSHFIKLAAR